MSFEPRTGKYRWIANRKTVGNQDMNDFECVSIINRPDNIPTLLSDYFPRAKPADSLLGLAYWFTCFGIAIRNLRTKHGLDKRM